MSDLDAACKALMAAAVAALKPDPTLRPVVFVIAADGSYQWEGRGTTRDELVSLFIRVIQGLAANQQVPLYVCSACSEAGNAHGTPPLPGWAWTSKGAFLCPSCRSDLGEAAPVLQLVGSSAHRVAGLAETEPPDTLVDDLLDEPDLGQAPSNLGRGPVPLFLDGEDPEDEILLDLSGQEAIARERARELDLAVMNRGREAVGMEPLTAEQLEQKRNGG